MNPTAVRLWDFSLAHYRNPEVERVCLTLQERWGANVNILLWLHWLEMNNIPVGEQQLTAAQNRIDAWEQNIVRPLRDLRAHLKAQFKSQDEAVGQTRQSLKNAELAAEQVEQEWLEQLAEDWKVATSPIKQHTNLANYLHKLNVPSQASSEIIKIFTKAGIN